MTVQEIQRIAEEKTLDLIKGEWRSEWIVEGGQYFRLLRASQLPTHQRAIVIYVMPDENMTSFQITLMMPYASNTYSNGKWAHH